MRHAKYVQFKGFIYLFFVCMSSMPSAKTAPYVFSLTAGGTDVKYDGQSDVGYYWAATASIPMQDYWSLNSGYSKTTAKIPNRQDEKKDFVSESVPLSLQFSYPIQAGSVYFKGGGNYYKINYDQTINKGIELTGVAGFRALPILGVSIAAEVTYFGQMNLVIYSEVFPGLAIQYINQEYGDAKTTNLAIGGSVRF